MDVVVDLDGNGDDSPAERSVHAAVADNDKVNDHGKKLFPDGNQ